MLIGPRLLPSRYCLAPLAGYTHLAFRRVIREQGGLGLATTDLVQATYLASGHRRSEELIATHPDDQPLSVQIFGGDGAHLARAARVLEDRGYQGIDINMGCPMAKINGQGGGARVMCNPEGACRLVEQVVAAVAIPVTVKMRLGWDRKHLTAPHFARQFEELGVAAITIHGRTREQGFHGSVDLDGIAQVAAAVQRIPVIGNGDVRTVEDARRMERVTGCRAIAIGRGALLDPWIFRRLAQAERGEAYDGMPTPSEQIGFLRRHFALMLDQHGPDRTCLQFRKFAAWYGARLGIPEHVEDRLRRCATPAEFDDIADQALELHGTRRCATPTAFLKVPNGPVEHW